MSFTDAITDLCIWVLTLGPVLTTPCWHVLLNSNIISTMSFYDTARKKAVDGGYFCEPIVHTYQSINPYFSREKCTAHRKPWWRPLKQSKCADGVEQIAPLWQCPLLSLYVCVHVYLCMCIFPCSLVLLLQETADLLFSMASYLCSHSPEAEYVSMRQRKKQT